MARDDDGDKSRRRWGRGGKPEEGPSEEELGWLADLRGSGREERTPFSDDEPTGRGRRGADPGATGTGSTGAGRRFGRTPAEPPTPPPPTDWAVAGSPEAAGAGAA